ncbi:MAG: GNAT family N-acetyltransferase [Pikeienuella sp.]
MTFPTTARLILRPFLPSDAEPFAALNADADVMAEFPKTLTRAESDQIIESAERKRAECGFGFAAVAMKNGTFLGMCGLNVPGYETPFSPSVEIGWRFARPAWGNGYASEAACAWLAFGFEAKGLEEIVAFTALTNTRSEAVMHRIGMKRDETGDFLHPRLEPDHRLAPHVLYRIKREDFRP